MNFNFGRKRSLSWKVREYISLVKSIKDIDNELNSLASEFALREKANHDLVKSEFSIDSIESINKRFESFRKSHLKSIGEVKKKKDKIQKSINSLLKNEDSTIFMDLVNKERSRLVFTKTLSDYRSGKIELSICDSLIKSVIKSKTRYADNIVINEKGQILLLKRSELDKSKPGYYTIPGGHVDIGEDCETAAKRELQEEAGIKVIDVIKVGEFENSEVKIEYFQSNVDNVEPVLQEEEIWSYEWVDPRDLKDYRLPFNMGENLDKILFPVKHQVISIKKACEDGKIDEKQRDILLKSVLEKAKSGIYQPTAENKKLGRVGQHYGEKKNSEVALELMKKFKSTFGKLLIFSHEKLNQKSMIFFEKELSSVASSLPNGHFKNNDFIKRISLDFDRGSGYACYRESDKKIILSKDFIESNLVEDKIEDIEDSTEVRGVLAHEIGHAVHKKFLQQGSYMSNEQEIEDEDTGEIAILKRDEEVEILPNESKFKQFAELCGFSRFNAFDYEKYGDTKKLIRQKRSGKSLITDYAETNPTEAFAEYYSFYSLNKEKIDNILENHKLSILGYLPENSIKYRNNSIAFNKVKEGEKIFNWLKENIFTNEELIKSLYDELEVEVGRLNSLRDSLMKSETGVNYLDNLDQIIEKAAKDISKLQKIKKLVVKNGKLYFATYYVKTGVEEVDEEKVIKVPDILKDFKEIPIGIGATLSDSSKTVTGTICGMSFNSKQNTHWIALKDDSSSEGKINYFNSKTLKSISLEDEEKYKKENEKKEEFGYKFVKNLGGSTGAILVENKFGEKFVRKTGKDKEHIQTEYEALQLYKLLGVRTPEIVDFDEEKGELLTEYINGELLNSFLASGQDLKGITDSATLELGIGADILLANWDAVGLSRDNMIVSGDKSDYYRNLYRIDVGGSLGKRAQGGDKSFTGEVREIETMLDPKISPQFSDFVKSTGVDTVAALERVVEAAEYALAWNSSNPFIKKYNSVLRERVNFIKEYVKEKKKEQLGTLIERINYPGKIYDIHEGYYGKDIASFYERVNEDMKVTPEDLIILQEMDSTYKDESSAYKSARQYADSKTLFDKTYPKLKELGVTDLEIKAISDYTSSDYGQMNRVLESYTTSETGNINLTKEKLVDIPSTKQSKTTDFSNQISSLDNHFEAILSAVKTVNFHHSKGDTEYNKDKLASFEKMKKEILSFSKDIIDNKEKYSKAEKSAVRYLTQKIVQVEAAIKVGNGEIPSMSKPKYFSEIKYKSAEEPQKSVEKEYAFKNIMEETINKDSHFNWARVKLLTNGIRKMENSMDPEINIKGTFTRNLELKGEKQEEFIKQHQVEGDYVVHQRTGGSAYKKSVFSSHNTTVKIHGSGALIKAISGHEGEEEVLHKPFTLYRNSALTLSNSNGKLEVVLDKIL